MYPTLSHLTENLFEFKIGFPIQTFTFFIVIAFIIGAYLLARELKRKEKQGLMYLVFNRFGDAVQPHQQVRNIIVIAAITGLIGAKLLSILLNYNQFTIEPLAYILSVDKFAFYGGLILGTISVIYYAKKVYLKIIHLLDAAAPALMLSYSIGRLGGHLSGNGSWGTINLADKPIIIKFLPDCVWACNYPHNMINKGVLLDNCFQKYCYVLQYPVFPTSFYEFLICVLLFVLLWRMKRKLVIAGSLFVYYLFFLAIERLFIEQIKEGTRYNISGILLTQPEIVSYLLILFCFTLFYLARRNKLNW
ncbi:MAG: prolipoprotein diacylglyceryl transferase family protein [Bacteroidota bacterium]